MNSVTFHLAVDPKSKKTTYISARVVTPLGKEFHVSYHYCVDATGQRSGIHFGLNGEWVGGVFIEAQDTNGIWLEDRSANNMFCSELFEALTGKYPYEVENWIEPNHDYAPFASAMSLDR